MLPAEFEPAVPASKWPHTHFFDHAVTGIGQLTHYEVTQLLYGVSTVQRFGYSQDNLH
jgi:hypothetical protein